MKKDPKEKQSVKKTVRFTPVEAKQVEKAAKSHPSEGEFIRQATIKALKSLWKTL